MQLATAAMEALGVLMLMGAFGWWMRARGLVTSASMPVLSAIALDFALPCLVFTVIVDRFRPLEMPGWHRLPLAWAGFTVVALPLSLLAGFAARRRVRAEFRASCFYQNALFLPLAMLTGMYGADSKEVAQLFLAAFLFPAMLFNTSGIFFGRGAKIDWRKTAHPVLFATVAAVALAMAGRPALVPSFAMRAMRQVGAVSVPLVLLMLGARMREEVEHGGPVYWREIAAFVLIRNIAFPLFFIGALRALGIGGEAGFLVMIQAAMPPVTAAPVVIEREGGNVSFAGQLMLAGYGAALVSIPLSFSLFAAAGISW
ncbi:MAG: hypothetical protein FJ224_07670 [Lentisphaerae bacterium]|nr:hypothetical protein [Lentisphaerota bacterium]